MKPIPDAVANAMPEIHDSFVEWVQASNEANAAIRQGRPDVAAMVKASHEKLDAYLTAVRVFNIERRKRLDGLLRGGGRGV